MTRLRWGSRLFQHLKPFAAHRAIETDEAGDIAARTGEAGNESGAERIADPGEHDRHLPGHGLEQFEREIAPRHEDIGGKCELFRNSGPHLLRPAGPPAHIGANVAALHPPQFFEFAAKRRQGKSRLARSQRCPSAPRSGAWFRPSAHAPRAATQPPLRLKV